MDRIWLKKYPAGVPADIDTNQYNSLSDLLVLRGALLPSRVQARALSNPTSHLVVPLFFLNGRAARQKNQH